MLRRGRRLKNKLYLLKSQKQFIASHFINHKNDTLVSAKIYYLDHYLIPSPPLHKRSTIDLTVQRS